MAVSAGPCSAVGQATSDVRYNGVVKKLIPGTPLRPAHGFIDCAETAILFGRDVFLHDQLAATLQVGQPVSFAVGLNAKGMPQAVDVVAEGAPLQDPSLLRPDQQQQQAQLQQGLPFPAQPQIPSGERLAELILPEVTPALQSGMQSAVAGALIGAAELLGVTKQMQVQLATVAAAHDSQFHSSMMRSLRTRQFPAAAAGMDHSDGWHMSGGCWWGKGARQPRFEPYSDFACSGAAAHAQAALPQGSGPFEGVVKSIAPKGGSGGEHTYGFVECEETRKLYGRDVFLHSNQAMELEVGVRVSFEVGLNPRGMPQAHNIVRLS